MGLPMVGDKERLQERGKPSHPLEGKQNRSLLSQIEPDGLHPWQASGTIFITQFLKHPGPAPLLMTTNRMQ